MVQKMVDVICERSLITKINQFQKMFAPMEIINEMTNIDGFQNI